MTQAKNPVHMIRLSTGEELLAEVVSREETTTTYKNPIQIQVVVGSTKGPNGETIPALTIVPWFSMMWNSLGKGARTGIPFKNIHIMWEADVSAELVTEYKKAFSSILTPKSSLLIPGN